MGYEELKLRSLDETINKNDLRCLDEGKEALKEGIELFLEQGKAQEDRCSLEPTHT